MRESFRVFMEGIIDYAGLFPPADLSLDEAIRNFAGYRKGDEAWMLSRFIIPAGRLADLEDHHEWLAVSGSPFAYSVLGSVTDTVGDYHREVDRVVECCRQFKATGEGHGEMLEIKLPSEAAFSCDEDLLITVIDDTARQLDTQDDLPGRVFYETYLEENWKKDVVSVLDALSRHNSQRDSAAAGFKLRCGGLEPEDFPALEQVAFILNRARDREVPVKCTAGLHHPVRHYSYDVQTKMHGFFNVFGGGMLSHANKLDDDTLSSILSEEDSGQFVFSEGGFGWNDWSVSVEEMQKLRKTALVSFGSCSFDEPREDLRNLGLL